MMFSEESSRAVHEMGKHGVVRTETNLGRQLFSVFLALKHVPEGLNMCQCGVWLRPNLSTMDRNRSEIAAFKTPHYSASVIISRGKKSGVNPCQKDHKKAMDAKRGVLKRGNYTSILDRWQNDEVYRESQLVHGLTEEWVKYLDCISKIDTSRDAPHQQRLRYESTVCMRGVDSNKQAGPLVSTT